MADDRGGEHDNVVSNLRERGNSYVLKNDNAPAQSGQLRYRGRRVNYGFEPIRPDAGFFDNFGFFPKKLEKQIPKPSTENDDG